LEDPEAAEISFAIAKQKFESDDFFYAKRSGLYVLIGQPDLAIEDANTAIALNPDRAFAYIYRGQAYEMMGDISTASADYERANEAAERTGNAKMQVIARMHLAQILQQGIPLVTATPE
jgi:tetratricopeptide (TPR) repeat protein